MTKPETEEVEEAEQRFKRIDKDGGKKLALDEFEAAQKQQQSDKKKFQPERLQSAEKN